MDAVRQAQRQGEVDPGLEPEQLAFELDALLALGNTAFLLNGTEEALERARRGLDDRIARARADGLTAAACAGRA